MRNESSLPRTLQDDGGGWLALFGKVAPILGGVGAVGSLINSIISAQKTAAFQEQLINSLQAMEQTLQGIKNDLDAIYQELKNVEQDIEGLGLNDKMNAIDTWSDYMLALDPADTHGAQKLATSMLKGTQGAGSLLGCMVSIHNAIIGEGIGTPLIKLMDAPSFLRLRARLVRGLQLLAFATAFNADEKYDYGVFLLQWAVNFQQETDLYFAAEKDAMPAVVERYESQDPKINTSSTDGIALYQFAQPQLENVGVALVRPGYDPLLLYRGTLAATTMKGYGWYVLSFDEGDAPETTCFIDLLANVFTTDKNSPLAATCETDSSGRYWIVYTSPIASSTNDYVTQCTLVCGARYDSGQTFLGAAAGQIHWLEATGDRATLVSSIHDGSTTDAALVTCDMTSKTAKPVPFSGLRSLSQALWTTSWVAGNAVMITLSAATDQPLYLGADAAGNWQISTEQQIFGVLEAPAPVPGLMQNPLQMPPTPVTLRSTMGGEKTVLFRQF